MDKEKGVSVVSHEIIRKEHSRYRWRGLVIVLGLSFLEDLACVGASAPPLHTIVRCAKQG